INKICIQILFIHQTLSLLNLRKTFRSEERRVGKECRFGRSPYYLNKRTSTSVSEDDWSILQTCTKSRLNLSAFIMLPLCAIAVLIFFFKQKTAYEIET